MMNLLGDHDTPALLKSVREMFNAFAWLSYSKWFIGAPHIYYGDVMEGGKDPDNRRPLTELGKSSCLK